MQLGRKGHSNNDTFKLFADYVLYHMKLIPSNEWRLVFSSLTRDCKYDVNEVGRYVFNELEEAGFIKCQNK